MAPFPPLLKRLKIRTHARLSSTYIKTIPMAEKLPLSEICAATIDLEPLTQSYYERNISSIPTITPPDVSKVKHRFNQYK